MTIASTTPAAQSDDPVLDELIGTATNTALLPEPDAHAYDDIATGDADPLGLGGGQVTTLSCSAGTSSPAASSSARGATT